MHATITAETPTAVELTVTDAEKRRHDLEITPDGHVESHQSEGSPVDLTEQPRGVAEQFRQVRRFGKYYLVQKRGYESLVPYSEQDRIASPERLAATALIVGSMSPAMLGSEFETIYHQRKSATEAEPTVVEPPAGSQGATCQRIEQDIALRVDPERLQTLLDVLVELEGLGGLRQLMDMYPEKSDQRSRLSGILGVGDQSFIRGTSPVRVYWETAGGNRVTAGTDGTAPEAPIACRIQLPVRSKPVRSAAAFQRLLVDHLLCQLRDCYVGMGVAPPRDLRVQGPGIAAMTAEYTEGSSYQRYHDPDAVIDWTRLPPAPSF